MILHPKTLKKHVKRLFKNPPELRRPYDFYPTPPHATRALLKREAFAGPILEPAAGDGAIVRVLRRAGYSVKASDIQKGQDFYDLADPVPSIVTNPPYQKLVRWVEHCKALARQKIALLLPVEFLHGQSRYELFQDRRFPLARVHVFSARLDFSTGKRATVGHAWYVWQRDHLGEPIVRWIGQD